MALDRYGLVVSTASALALDAYVEAVDCLLSANAGAEAGFDRAIAADPGFALAHIGRARSLQLQARVAEGREAAGGARHRGGGGCGARARRDRRAPRRVSARRHGALARHGRVRALRVQRSAGPERSAGRAARPAGRRVWRGLVVPRRARLRA